MQEVLKLVFGLFRKVLQIAVGTTQKSETVGYYSGATFQNPLHLTMQPPHVAELYTNHETICVRDVYVEKQKVLPRKARTEITTGLSEFMRAIILSMKQWRMDYKKLRLKFNGGKLSLAAAPFTDR